MDDAINHLKLMMNGPFLKKGKMISGLIHFKLENEKYGKFNTLRALKVLKRYDETYYKKIITK